MAQALGYPLVDAEVVQRAAYRISLHRENLTDPERAERLGKRLAALVIDLHDEPPDDVDWALIPAPAMSDPGYRRVIETMLREVSTRDGVVIAGYPGRFVIDRSVHAVHVLVIAPFATRVQRMVLREDLPFRTAERVLREADRDRADFYRRYYGVQWDDPALFDCVLNTARLGLDHAAAVAVALVQARGQGPAAGS